MSRRAVFHESVVSVDVDEATGVGTLTLNRPAKHNAINGQLIDEFIAGLRVLRADDSVRVVLTRAEGPSFSSGMDLHYLRGAAQEAATLDWDVTRVRRGAGLNFAVQDFPKPTVAAVHGYCLGGGVSLMLAHDVVFAARNAQIGMPEILRGSFGQVVGGNLISGGIPIKKMVAIQLLGRNLSGAEAAKLGIASFVVEDDELENTALQAALEIAERDPEATRHEKIAVRLARDRCLTNFDYFSHLVEMRQWSSAATSNEDKS
jgi:enoyl-CoA hydratase/carnithine racemase